SNTCRAARAASLTRLAGSRPKVWSRKPTTNDTTTSRRTTASGDPPTNRATTVLLMTAGLPCLADVCETRTRARRRPSSGAKGRLPREGEDMRPLPQFSHRERAASKARGEGLRRRLSFLQPAQPERGQLPRLRLRERDDRW